MRDFPPFQHVSWDPDRAELRRFAAAMLLGFGVIGLSLWPADWQDATLAAHGDLYRRHREGFACLHIREGRVTLGSVTTAPFGVKILFDPSHFERPPMPGNK